MLFIFTWLSTSEKVQKNAFNVHDNKNKLQSQDVPLEQLIQSIIKHITQQMYHFFLIQGEKM